jgi:xanthine dehydrogenase YagR molybdenum-binding subunit
VSTCARGQVAGADTAAALAVPGVLAVLTHDNVLGLRADGDIPPAHEGARADLLPRHAPTEQ